MRIRGGRRGREIRRQNTCVEVGVWRTSSYSNGGSDTCVEVGAWRKSSHSNGGMNNCVEVGHAAPVVLVRDTTDRAGAVLAIPASAWRALLAEIRSQPGRGSSLA